MEPVIYVYFPEVKLEYPDLVRENAKLANLFTKLQELGWDYGVEFPGGTVFEHYEVSEEEAKKQLKELGIDLRRMRVNEELTLEQRADQFMSNKIKVWIYYPEIGDMSLPSIEKNFPMLYPEFSELYSISHGWTVSFPPGSAKFFLHDFTLKELKDISKKLKIDPRRVSFVELNPTEIRALKIVLEGGSVKDVELMLIPKLNEKSTKLLEFVRVNKISKRVLSEVLDWLKTKESIDSVKKHLQKRNNGLERK
jgi:hypothetical protein